MIRRLALTALLFLVGGLPAHGLQSTPTPGDALEPKLVELSKDDDYVELGHELFMRLDNLGWKRATSVPSSLTESVPSSMAGKLPAETTETFFLVEIDTESKFLPDQPRPYSGPLLSSLRNIAALCYLVVPFLILVLGGILYNRGLSWKTVRRKSVYLTFLVALVGGATILLEIYAKQVEKNKYALLNIDNAGERQVEVYIDDELKVVLPARMRCELTLKLDRRFKITPTPSWWPISLELRFAGGQVHRDRLLLLAQNERWNTLRCFPDHLYNIGGLNSYSIRRATYRRQH